MRMFDCAPVILFRIFFPSDGSAAARIHQSHSREVWRNHGMWTVWYLLAALVVWPPYILGAMSWATWLNGFAIKKRTGKSLVRQVLEQGQLACAHSIPPRWYYGFELYDDSKRRRASEYVQRGETKYGVYKILKRTEGAPLSPLTDKVSFAVRCQEHNLRAVPVIMALEGGAFIHYSNGKVRLPKEDLFIKPNHGKGGRGAERWRYRQPDVYEGAGAMLSEAELVQHLRRLPFKEGCIVQPCRVNHPVVAELSNGALATVRIVTCRNEHGGFEATNAVLRMAQGRNTVVDNFHAGGLAAKVDLESGVLECATDLGVRPTTGWRGSSAIVTLAFPQGQLLSEYVPLNRSTPTPGLCFFP